MIVIIQQWAVVAGFLGVIIAMLASFSALSYELKRKYGVWFQISIILTILATLAQITCAAIPL